MRFYIATPTYAHCPQTLKALEHGKHVLCEKIMAVNANEAEQMIECAKKNQVILLEAMRPAFDPAYQLIMEKSAEDRKAAARDPGILPVFFQI